MLIRIMWEATMNEGTLLCTLRITKLATLHSIAQDVSVIKTQAQ